MCVRNCILLTTALLLSLLLFGCGGAEDGDLTPPDFTIGSSVPSVTSDPWDSSTPWSFNGTSDPGSEIDVTVYFPTTDPVPTIDNQTVNPDGTWSFEVYGLVEGTNTFAIDVSDEIGNSTVYYVTMVLDQTGPTVTLNQYATPTTTATQTLAGTVAELDASDVEVSVDGGTNWNSVDDINGGIWSFAVNLVSAPGVTYDIWVRSVDKLGNKVEVGDPDEDVLIVKKQIEVDAAANVFTIAEDDAGPVYMLDPANNATLQLTGTRTADYPVGIVDITPVSSLTVDDTTDNINWTADFTTLPAGNTEVTFGLTDLSVPDPIEVAQTKVLIVRDQSGPLLIDSIPIHGAAGVAIATDLTLVFSETMDPATVTNEMIILTDEMGSQVPFTLNLPSAAVQDREFTFTPDSALTGDMQYSLSIVNPDPQPATDVYGNAFVEPTTVLKFTTAP